VFIGKGEGQSSPLLRLEIGGGVATTWNVQRVAQSEEVGQHALCLVSGHASSALTMYNADVGIAIEPGQTTTLAAFRTGYEVSPSNDAQVEFGAGVTLSGCTMDLNGGQVDIYSNASVVNLRAGLFRHFGTATIGTFTGYGGEWHPYSTGTVTSTTVYDGCVVDHTHDPRARTHTNAIVLRKGATWRDPHKCVTASAGFSLPDGNKNVNADWGQNITVTIS
jgi:hypothetical protein